MQTSVNRTRLNGKTGQIRGSNTSASQARPLVVQLIVSKPSFKNASARALSILSPTEVRDLLTCEDIIAKGWDTFIEVGRALAQIRDKRLYRADFLTFETYCRQKWNYGKSQAYRLIGAAEVVQHLSPIGDIPLPRNESQVRPLLGLKPEEVKAVWREAVQKAGQKTVTAKLVKQMAEQLKGPKSFNRVISTKERKETAEHAVYKAEEFVGKARQALNAGDGKAALSLLHQLRLFLESSTQKP